MHLLAVYGSHPTLFDDWFIQLVEGFLIFISQLSKFAGCRVHLHDFCRTEHALVGCNQCFYFTDFIRNDAYTIEVEPCVRSGDTGDACTIRCWKITCTFVVFDRQAYLLVHVYREESSQGIHARVEVNLVALRSPCDAFYIVLIVGSEFLHETSEILRVKVSKNLFHVGYEKTLLVGFITVSFHADEGELLTVRREHRVGIITHHACGEVLSGTCFYIVQIDISVG